jgi:hypothetical protein
MIMRHCALIVEDDFKIPAVYGKRPHSGFLGESFSLIKAIPSALAGSNHVAGLIKTVSWWVKRRRRDLNQRPLQL